MRQIIATEEKEKKAHVRFFLNKKLAPIYEEQKRRKLYPLYIQVTLDRRNMTLRSKYRQYYANMREVPAELTALEESILLKTIEMATEQAGGKFQLKGLADRYDLYSTPVYELLEEYLKPRLKAAILETGHPFAAVLNYDSPDVSVTLLQQALFQLIPRNKRRMEAWLRDSLEVYDLFLQFFDLNLRPYASPLFVDWNSKENQDKLIEKVKARYSNYKATVQSINGLVSQAMYAKNSLRYDI